MFFFDTETCGFHGPTVLIQYAHDDLDIHLHEVWCEPIWSTLELIQRMCDEEAVVGFNLAYDWFHIAQTYTVLELLAEQVGYDAEPRDHIGLYAELEPLGRDGPCVKPRSALDLLLYARKGPYQETMERKDIRIRRVPTALATSLVHELDRRIRFNDYLFARGKKTKERWKIFPSRDVKTRKPDPNFRDIVLRFSPSAALKTLAIYELKIPPEEVLLMKDVHVESGLKLLEVGWAPFAKALSSEEKGWKCKVGGKNGYAWPAVIERHIAHWRYRDTPRKYATDDVVYTRGLYHAWDDPDHGDDDSILACLVGASRWRGFRIDEDKIKALMEEELRNIEAAPRAPHHVARFLREVMSETEAVAFTEEGSTKKVVLERIAKWKDDGQPTKAAIRAKAVLDSRKGYNKVTLFRKLLQAGRFHASATVIGSLSGRNSGRTEVGDGKRASNLNALGIQHDSRIRECFPLADGDLILCGGDFSAFEVSIADARYDDPALRKQLLTCNLCEYTFTADQYRSEVYCPKCRGAYDKCRDCRKEIAVYCEKDSPCECGGHPKGSPEAPLRKIHALFAMALHPGRSYNEIQASKATDNDMYDKGKKGFFGGLLYGGDENTLHNRLGIEIEVGRKARADFLTQYQGILRSQKEIFDRFCSMRQPGGIGKAVEWHEPAEFVESLNGFRRWFTLENRICESLFKLANKVPKEWDQIERRVFRRDRWQKMGGAIRSALYACAFQIQVHNMRAATNHEIQSTGAILCKQLQVLIWGLQPAGIHPWRVQPFNIHDELMCPALPELIDELERIVAEFIEEAKKLIPLIKIDWSSRMETWAEK